MSDWVKTLEDDAREIAKALSGEVEWKWDERFGSALAEFPVELKDDLLGLLERYLISSWDASSASEAPDVVQQVMEKLGGLMSGQLLLLTDVNEAAFIYCAWWPWGSGAKISIRIAPFARELTDEDAASLEHSFRGWFEI